MTKYVPRPRGYYQKGGGVGAVLATVGSVVVPLLVEGVVKHIKKRKRRRTS